MDKEKAKKNEYLLTKDHCVGNYPSAKRPLLEQAIRETGASVRIKDTATDARDRVVPGRISVWTTEVNLSSFWVVYKRLVTESEKDERW